MKKETECQKLFFLLRPILALLLLFGLLGYFMFVALFVGIGATMDDLQSASNTQGMVFMLPWIPVIFIGPVFSNPGGIIAQVASIFPLISPLLMIARLGLTKVPAWEIILSAGLLVLTILFFIKMASKNAINDPTKATYYLYEIDSKVVGQLMVTREWSDWRNGYFWWIQSVYVHPEYRRRGIYRALYTYLEEIVQKDPEFCGI